MSVKVTKVIRESSFLWRDDPDGTHVLKRTGFLSFFMKKNGIDYVAEIRFCGESTDGRGFKCDGLSVPWFARWFLPTWDENNSLYNLAGATHDGLYLTKGYYGFFTREECDDIFRGLLRESKISRFKAGCADKAVEWFAGGDGHWGNDSYDVKSLFRMSVEVVKC